MYMNVYKRRAAIAESVAVVNDSNTYDSTRITGLQHPAIDTQSSVENLPCRAQLRESIEYRLWSAYSAGVTFACSGTMGRATASPAGLRAAINSHLRFDVTVAAQGR